MEQYPTRQGLPVNPNYFLPHELEFEADRTQEYTNHHWCWTARQFGRLAIFNTLRNLDTMQSPLLSGAHEYLHANYSPQELPTPQVALDVVAEAYEVNIPLRFGSLLRPKYKPITYELMEQLKNEYRRIQ